MPDDDLCDLPFAALRDAEGSYLVERHVIFYAPSATAMVALKHRIDTRREAHAVDLAHGYTSALLVGDPDFQGWAKQLPAAQEEVRYVRAELKPSGCHAVVLTGAEATAPRIVDEMREHELVHLATHRMGDSLLFSAASMEEGELSASRLQLLRLSKTKLIVLNAGDLARGRARKSGVNSISRACFAAGVPVMLASLWSTDEVSSPMLVQRFYNQMLRSGVDDVAEVLQHAIVSMIHDVDEPLNALPRNWAFFVLYGLAVPLKASLRV